MQWHYLLIYRRDGHIEEAKVSDTLDYNPTMSDSTILEFAKVVRIIQCLPFSRWKQHVKCGGRRVLQDIKRSWTIPKPEELKIDVMLTEHRRILRTSQSYLLFLTMDNSPTGYNLLSHTTFIELKPHLVFTVARTLQRSVVAYEFRSEALCSNATLHESPILNRDRQKLTCIRNLVTRRHCIGREWLSWSK